MAFIKPSDVPNWADDDVNNVDPGTTKSNLGWVFQEVPPSSFENFRAQLVGQWFKYINERVFDGATSQDFRVQGVDRITADGADLDGGDMEVSGGQATGDGGCLIDFETVIAGQGSGTTERPAARVGGFGTDGRFDSTEGFDVVTPSVTVAGTDTVTVIGGASTGTVVTAGDGVVAIGGDGSGGSSVTGGDGVKTTGGASATAGDGINTAGGAGTAIGGHGIVAAGGSTGGGASTIGRAGIFNGIVEINNDDLVSAVVLNTLLVEGVSNTVVRIVGNGTSSRGLSVTSTGTSTAIDGFGGNSVGTGVRGVGGVSSGRGVRGEGGASGGIGVDAVGGADGHGLVVEADTTSPVRSAMRIVPQDTDPTTALAGDITVLENASAVGGRLAIHDGDAFHRPMMKMFQNIVDSDTVVNTTVALIFNQRYSMPANYLEIGDTIRVVSFVELGFTGGPRFEIDVMIGSQAFGLLSLPMSSGVIGARIVVSMSVRAVGASGDINALIEGYPVRDDGSFTAVGSNFITAAAVDLTIANDIAIRGRWDTADAANTATLKHIDVVIG